MSIFTTPARLQYVVLCYVMLSSCVCNLCALSQVQDKDDTGYDDDEGDAVTYSTVKASSSSAGASADPTNLYATVN